MGFAAFSEFSYGYALTHSLIQQFGSSLVGAPVFPSLIQEGMAGGGYDLKLPLVPLPLFLQFKVPSVLTRNSKLRPMGYPLPYYRMPLRTKKPNQHQLLLNLETTEPLVFYASPLFHEIDHLDKYFLAATVNHHSIFVRPTQIGTLDDKAHQLTYRSGVGDYWIYSEPTKVAGSVAFEEFSSFVSETRAVFRQRRRLVGRQIGTEEADSLRRAGMTHLARVFREISDAPPRDEPLVLDYVSVRPDSPLRGFEKLLAPPGDESVGAVARRLSYFAQVHLGVSLAFIEAADPPIAE